MHGLPGRVDKILFLGGVFKCRPGRVGMFENLQLFQAQVPFCENSVISLSLTPALFGE